MAFIEEIQQKVAVASQESLSEEVVSKLKQKAYRFRQKGSEAQFTFTSAVEGHMQGAKHESAK